IGSGNSFQQECRPLICTNPSGNAICSQEGSGRDVTGCPPVPGACEASFDNLTASQKSAFENIFPTASPAPG
ncbi:MAG: hypothetical protein WBY71_09845, partial [Nitrososphaeraceae archaeon]